MSTLAVQSNTFDLSKVRDRKILIIGLKCFVSMNLDRITENAEQLQSLEYKNTMDYMMWIQNYVIKTLELMNAYADVFDTLPDTEFGKNDNPFFHSKFRNLIENWVSSSFKLIRLFKPHNLTALVGVMSKGNHECLFSHGPCLTFVEDMRLMTDFNHHIEKILNIMNNRKTNLDWEVNLFDQLYFATKSIEAQFEMRMDVNAQ
jgi:hypothetical protein